MIKHTVEPIFKRQESVAETSKKIRRLEEYSQQISDTVIIINDVALQTKLLAVNTEIKAAHIEKENQDFSLLIEEFTLLATKCVNTTYELEQIANNIQLETSQVIKATKVDANQLIKQSHLVSNTKKRLEQIARETHQFHERVDSILNTTFFQTEGSKTFTCLIEQLSESSGRTIISFKEVLKSSHGRVQLVQNLQVLINQFKVK